MSSHKLNLVSILVPVYNRENLLAQTLGSALSQTIQDIEVVVVDNASTDGTWAICEDYARRDTRVRIFRNGSNLGPVRNWQRCLDEARGGYAKILFSDDTMDPSYLEKTLPLIQDDRVGFVFTSIRTGEQPDNAHDLYRWQNRTDSFPSGRFMMESLLGSTTPLSPGAALFRLEDLRKNLHLDIPSLAGTDFTRWGAGPDVLLYLLAAYDYPEIGYVAEPLTFFRMHPGSISIREGDNQIDDHYYQAKVWFAQQVSTCRIFLKGTLLQQLLVYGWMRARRKEPGLEYRVFACRYLETPPDAGLLVKVAVRFRRLAMKIRNRKSS